MLDALLHQLVGAGVAGRGELRSRPFIGETGISSSSLSQGMSIKVWRAGVYQPGHEHQGVEGGEGGGRGGSART